MYSDWDRGWIGKRIVLFREECDIIGFDKFEVGGAYMELKEFQNKDMNKVIRFAIDGMHFDLYLKNR